MIEQDRVVVYESLDGWRWHRVAPNGRVVSESGEAFTSHAYAVESATRYNVGAVVEDVVEKEES